MKDGLIFVALIFIKGDLLLEKRTGLMVLKTLK